MKILTIEVMLAVGILLNILKGGDLILRESQRRWVQERFESATLLLEEFKPMTWLDGLRTPRAQAILVVIGLAEFALVTLVNMVWMHGSESVGIATLGTGFKVTGVLVVVLSFLCFPVIFRWGPRTVGWLFEARTGASYFGRFFWVLGIGYAAMFAYLLAVFGFAWMIEPADDLMSMVERMSDLNTPEGKLNIFSSLLIWPVFTYFWVIVQVGGLILLAFALTGILELLLKFLRGLAWRVAEYQKGAFAALILLATVGLGVWSVYARSAA